MDFIDPIKQRQNKIQLAIGYFLAAVAILLTTIVLLFLAYGYGLGKNGQIIQNGLVFVSSAPNPANIYLNGVLSNSTTNSRLQLPAGQYTLKLVRDGYRPWLRSLGVEGGSVEHFDYPFLFPTSLVTTSLLQLSSTPSIETQTPDRHWLLVQQPDNISSFYEYDLSAQKQVASTLSTLTIPANLFNNTGLQSWSVVQWSTDNRHVLLAHQYKGGSEYILFDRQTPSDSLNLTNALNLLPGEQLGLNNEKYNQYYLFMPSSRVLDTVSLSDTTPKPELTGVLAYKSYGSNIVLYVTGNGAAAGSVKVDIWQSGQTYLIQHLPVSRTYLLDITQFSGNWFVACGSELSDKVYVYENPVSELQAQPNALLVPVQILKVSSPNYLSFSDNTQFIVAESGDNFAVYDNENDKAYSYTLSLKLAKGQHATWMDGDRLTLTAENDQVVLDYDDANQQRLEPVVNGTVPFFDQNYKWLYAIAPLSRSTSQGKVDLTQTALRIPTDQ